MSVAQAFSRRTECARIIHVDLGCEFRGGQRQVVYLAAAQHQAGRPVLIVAPKGAPVLARARQHNIPTLALPARFDFDPRNIRSLSQALVSGDILHTHDARSASLGAFLGLLRRDVLLIHTRRVSYPLGRGWSRCKYSLGSVVVCVSAEVQDEVKRCITTPTIVISSAIVLSRYRPRLLGNGGRVGIIGALTEQKGHAQFFRALALLKKSPEVWIVGQGKLEAELHDLAHSLGLRNVVWKGQQESPEVLPFLDVLVVPSAHGEGSSGVIKEAWACKVPVICSDLPANLELVSHEKNGLVFTNHNPQDLAEQLQRIANDALLREKMIKAGSKDVLSYDVSFMRDAYDDVYRKVRSFSLA